MLNEMLVKLTDIIEKTELENISERVKQTQEKIVRAEKPQAALISDIYGKKMMLTLAAMLCGDVIDSECIPADDMPFVILISDACESSVSVTAEFFGEQAEHEYRKIIIEKPCEALKGMTLGLYCGLRWEFMKENILDEIDFLFLLTSAMMALPLNEKTWIRDTVTQRYDSDRFAVSLYNTAMLNSKSDAEALSEAVQSILNNIDENIAVKSTDEICHMILQIPEKSEELLEKRKEAIFRNCVAFAENAIEEHLKVCNIDVAQMKKIAENVEKERQNVETAGKITVNHVIDNLYSNLKFELLNMAYDYNEKAFESISTRISSTAELDKDIQKIEPYLANVWNKFSNAAETRIVAEQQVISERLTQQIECDCGKLTDLMLGMPGMENIGVTGYYTYQDYAKKSDEKERKDKKISKIVLAASLGLAIVGAPMLGLSTFVGSKIYAHLKKNKDAEMKRQEVLDELMTMQTEMKNKVSHSIEVEFEKLIGAAKANVEAVYTEVLDSLLVSIKEAVEKTEKIAKNRDILEKAKKELSDLR